MKASELKAADLAGYLRIEPEDLDGTETAMLDAFLNAARNYAQNYTGQTIERLDPHEDVAIAVLCLAGDLYTNRDMYTQLKDENGRYLFNDEIQNGFSGTILGKPV